MKKYYATGNGGNGAKVYAFDTKKQRDEFVAWNESFGQRMILTRAQAVRRGGSAIDLVRLEVVDM